jgi:hypothetical protein
LNHIEAFYQAAGYNFEPRTVRRFVTKHGR